MQFTVKSLVALSRTRAARLPRRVLLRRTLTEVRPFGAYLGAFRESGRRRASRRRVSRRHSQRLAFIYIYYPSKNHFLIFTYKGRAASVFNTSRMSAFGKRMMSGMTRYSKRSKASGFARKSSFKKTGRRYARYPGLRKSLSTPFFNARGTALLSFYTHILKVAAQSALARAINFNSVNYLIIMNLQPFLMRIASIVLLFGFPCEHSVQGKYRC